MKAVYMTQDELIELATILAFNDLKLRFTLVELRRQKRISQKEIAKMLGVKTKKFVDLNVTIPIRDYHL